MDEVKRRPGRPKGSEIDDIAPLMAIARRLTEDPKLPPKTAARREFKSSGRAAHTEDASIHRWQGKWKTGGAVYMQRVRDERAAAEAERQRRERAAVEACLSGLRQVRELAIGIGTLSQLVPRQAVGEAVFGIINQHREIAQSFGGAIAGLVERGMLPTRSSAFDALAKSKAAEMMTGRAVPDVWGSLINRQLGEAMRRHDTFGRTMERFTAIPAVKFPR